MHAAAQRNKYSSSVGGPTSHAAISRGSTQAARRRERPCDTIICPPDEAHAAADNTSMSHVAMRENEPSGRDPVAQTRHDQQYKQGKRQ